jgi:hypothetical protein
MGGSSSSSTKRTYQTQNISQQGRANVYGTGNKTTIYRADAITLDNIAAALAAGVEDMSRAGTDQVEAALDVGNDMTRRTLDVGNDMTRRTLDVGNDMTRRTLDVAERINRDALDSNTSVTRDAIDSNTSVTRDAMNSNTSVTRDAMNSLERLSLEIQQGAEKGTQKAMDFVSGFTEREQIGSEGEQLRTLQYVAAAVAVALVGIAWASKGSLKA